MARQVWVVESRGVKRAWTLCGLHWTKFDAENDARRHRTSTTEARVVRYIPSPGVWRVQWKEAGGRWHVEPESYEETTAKTIAEHRERQARILRTGIHWRAVNAP